jgi:hypothetical protein
MKILAKICLFGNPIKSEGATILADALGRNAMPSLTRLDLRWCGIEAVGFVTLVSALEQNESLQILNLMGDRFGERGFMPLAESLPNIKGLQRIDFFGKADIQSTTLLLLLEGFRKNTSLVEVNILGCALGEWTQEIKFLGQRNRLFPLLTASDSLDSSQQLGI